MNEENLNKRRTLFSIDIFATPTTFTLEESNYIAGISLNGVFIFSGASQIEYDAFFPKAYGINNNPMKIPIDTCLGSHYSYRTYRYHMFSPCL